MAIAIRIMEKFKDRGSETTRSACPTIYRRDVDEIVEKMPEDERRRTFNPNKNYLCFPKKEDKKKIKRNISPFYFLSLIPNRTVKGEPSLEATIYLLHFCNFAVYYCRALLRHRKSLPKYRTGKKELENERVFINGIWDAMADVSEIEVKEEAQEELNKKLDGAAKSRFKKSNVPISPAYFAKLCRFFSRAWYDEHFSSPHDTKGSVEFAHYVSNYIEWCVSRKPSSLRRYDGTDDNHKKEVRRLFNELKDNPRTIDHLNFRFTLEKRNTDTDNPFYAISIHQLGTEYSFYLHQRLYAYRRSAHS